MLLALAQDEDQVGIHLLPLNHHGHWGSSLMLQDHLNSFLFVPLRLSSNQSRLIPPKYSTLTNFNDTIKLSIK